MGQLLPEAMSPMSSQVSENDIELMTRVFGAAAARPQMIPSALMAYIIDYIQVSKFTIPVGQLTGFSQFTAQENFINATQTRSSSAYGDLATVGPEIDGLSDGNYLFLFGANLFSSGGNNADCSVAINGVAGTGLLTTQATTAIPGASAVVQRLSSGGGNSVKLVYRSANNSTPASFAQRWLVVLRYANL
jgi:hypothetical protein